MPRRLVKDGYRGWYGWEARFNSMIRMSLESMNNTNAKNKRERFEFSRCQIQIREDEKKYAERSRKDLYDLKQELFSIRAYGKIYQKYSFYHSDNAQLAESSQNNISRRNGPNSVETTQSSNRTEPEKTESKDIPSGAHVGSDNDVLEQNPDQKLETSKISAGSTGNSSHLPKIVVDLINQSASSCMKSGDKLEHGQNKRILPKGVRVSFADEEMKVSSESSNEDNLLPISENSGGELSQNVVDENNRSETANNDEQLIYEPKIHSLPSINTVFQKKQKDATERETKYKAEKRRKLLSKWNEAISVVREQVKSDKIESEQSETSSNNMDAKEETEENVSRNRKLTRAMEGHGEKTKQEIRAKIFPAECRNTFTLRRFIDKQAEDLLKVWTPETVRRHKVKKILEKVKFPELVHRNRSTSAIYRDYHVYERVKGLNEKRNDNVVEESVNETSLRCLKAKYGNTSPTSGSGSPQSQSHDMDQRVSYGRSVLHNRREATIAVPTSKRVNDHSSMGKLHPNFSVET